MSIQESLVDFVEEPEVVESIEPLSAEAIKQAVVYSTDWTTETLLAQLRRGNIFIDPKFQRRDAWTRARKSRFIESLILGLPIPQIVLAERKDRKGQYIVLDGKQRLLTLLQFTGGAEGRNNSFALSSLEVRQDLMRKRYSDFESDMLLSDDLNAFLNQPIRSVVIRNWPNADFLHTVFVRLNTGSVALSPQELREALFPGDFVDYVDVRAGESPALHHLLHITEPDFRMRDVEILIRYLAFAYFLPHYSGNFKTFLDNTCGALNERWADEEDSIKEHVSEFEAAVEAGITIFGPEHVGRKWNARAYEARLNRAVLDVVMFYLADRQIRDAALNSSEAVERAFRQVCEDPEFRNSIESTTKSIGATATRFIKWGVALRETLGLGFNLPELEDGRIHFNGLWP